MPWYEWVASVLLFIISLGALICIHEAGHLSMAKLFKVYCHEYSIGFGPALLHKRKEGHETYFSIRAIPFGGYVSMYGEEGTDLEEFKNLPAERSLEGIKKWKKAIIVSAGVILNAVLALVLIGISNIAFPIIGMTSVTIVEDNSVADKAGFVNGDEINYIYPDSQIEGDSIMPFEYEFTDNDNIIHAGNYFIVDTNVTMNDSHYVLGFMYQSNKGNPSFTEGLKLYRAVSKEEILNNTTEYKHVVEEFREWAKQEGSPDYFPNFEESPYKIDAETKFISNIQIRQDDADPIIKTIEFEGTDKGLKDVGLSFETNEIWLPFGERVKNTFIDYGDASVAVFRGIGVLFSGGIRNMSGIVGIFETSASLYSNYTFATYLYFWGLISVNLAIFNLLPFPGLDGWQLLVTAIEGISKKKLPNKFKTIMSLIGLGILFCLMIVIIVFDVARIAGA